MERAASTAMQGSDAAAPATCWDLVDFDQSSTSAGFGGSGFGQEHTPRSEDSPQAEVRRLAVKNNEIQRNAAQQAAYLGQQSYHALHHQAGFEHAAQQYEQARSDSGSD